MDLKPTLQQDDDWFALGYDEAHQDYLDDLGRVNDDSDDAADVAEDVR